MKYIGHLDTMRYFQKAIRRAQIPIAFSEGYSPHMILSFAAPLGVGITSLGEYFDMELTKDMPTAEICDRLNQTMAEGVTVVSARRVEDGKASKAMSLVAAADYQVTFREGCAPSGDWEKEAAAFCTQPAIFMWKKTKRSEKEVDIRPFIYEMYAKEGAIFMKLASASANYTKPELVMDAFCAYLGFEPASHAYQVQRLEVFADQGTEGVSRFVPLEELGEEVE
jgi:radical SAM-linked protein